MGEEPHRVYTNKPKKAQLRQPSAAAASFKMSSQSTAAPPPPPPPPPQKESFAKRYKFPLRLFLAANLGLGVYIFTRPKETSPEEEKSSTVSTSPATEPPVSSSPATLQPVKPRDPIPEDQQRELFKWMLEEKRKVKPKDPEEKRRIDEEKAILKQFIRAKTIPKI